MLQPFAREVTAPAGEGASHACAVQSVDRIGETMRVHTKLFATLVRLVPDTTSGIPFDVELPDGATVAALVDRLGLPADEVRMVFVNGRARSMDWVLNPDDDVGIFPPVGGG
jgi:molybdopterin synthase sulfur carrier subunit